MPKDDVLVAQLNLLHDELDHLKRLQDDIRSFDAWNQDWTRKRAVERALELCASACFAMGRHIISLESYRYPKSNAEVFIVLQEEGVLDEQIVATLIRMSAFRNIIVHEYIKADPTAIYGVFKNHLSDFDKFAQAVTAYMAED